MSARIFVPGRIEVLGKHTDYAGGGSLLVATERGFTFEAVPLPDDWIVIRAEATGEEIVYAIRRRGGVDVAAREASARAAAAVPAAREAELAPATGLAASGRHGEIDRPNWARYVDGVVHRAVANFGAPARGAHIRFRSDLPAAAGLSSSSALVTGIFLALDAVCGFDLPRALRHSAGEREALAGWLSAAEMGGPVGTRGGSEDHVAILCARPGRIVRYRLAPITRRGAAPVPEGWTFAVGASGVIADKGGAVQAHYNRLSDLAGRAAEAWQAAAASDGGPLHGRETLNLGDALEREGSAEAVLARVRAGALVLGEDVGPIVQRARHFVEECALVDHAFGALERGDVDAFAAAVNRSAARGAELLQNQVPETLLLARLALELGAAAASPFGGGFGGAVWALVRTARAEAFLDRWRARYHDAFPQRSAAEFFLTTAAAPARTSGSGTRT